MFVKKRGSCSSFRPLTNPFIEDGLFSVTCEEGTSSNFIRYTYWPKSHTAVTAC